MSKINAIRLINLNYNYNGIRIDDEVFQLNGESTLLSLRNGGGKSVLIQMLIAPFVRKRYRNTIDRQFSSYFTTNKPSFILVEWVLDANSGYVLTGMMVRKSQEIIEDKNQRDLDILQFVHEYKNQNPYDINNIPFIKNVDDNKVLMKYSDCKGLLESIKLDRNYEFSLFDMNNPTQSRSYFSKLEEYQIYHKEWESIVKKINIKESGLSELFTNAKDEAGLIESWFLPTVEDKLNKGKNRIEEFRDILGKYIRQYKDNKSKIDQKDIILLFKEETRFVLDIAENLKTATKEKSNLENKIANLIIFLRRITDNLDSDKITLEEKESILNDEIRRIEYEEISFKIHGFKDERLVLGQKLSKLMEIIEEKEIDRKTLIKRRNIQQCAKINKRYRQVSREVQEWENKLELIKEKDKDRTPEREALGYTLRDHYENESNIINTQINDLENTINLAKSNNKDLEKKLDNLRENEKENISKLSQINFKIDHYDELELEFNKLYKEDIRRNMLDEYDEGGLALRINNVKELIEQISSEIIKLKNTQHLNDEKLNRYKRDIQDRVGDVAKISQEVIGIEEKLRDLDIKIENRKSIIRHIGFNEDRIFHTEEILKEFKRRIYEVEEVVKAHEINLMNLEEEYSQLKSGKILELPDDIKEALEREGINYIYGMEWLKRNQKSPKENNRIVKNNPFIPYGLILTLNDIERLKSKDLGIYTSFPIPIIIRENLERNFEQESFSIYQGDMVNFYVLFNENLLDEEELSSILSIKKENIEKARSLIDTRLEDCNQYKDKFNKIFYDNLTEKNYRDVQNNYKAKIRNKESYENELNNLRDDEHRALISQEKLFETINLKEKYLSELNRKYGDLVKLSKDYDQYLIQRKDRIQIEDEIRNIQVDIKSASEEITRNRGIQEEASDSRREYLMQYENTKTKLQEYLRYDKRELVQKDIEDIEARYKALTSELTGELRYIEDSLSNVRVRFKEEEDELIRTSNRLDIKEEEFIDVIFDSFELNTTEDDISIIESEIKGLSNDASDLRTKIALKEQEIDNEFKKLKEDLNQEDLVPRNEIIYTEFKNRIVEKENELRRINTKLSYIINKINYFDNSLSTLAEYYDLQLMDEIEFNEDIASFDRESLDRFIGRLLRDYRQTNEYISNYEKELYNSIDKILGNDKFSDDFFNKPLCTLQTLIKDPVEFIEQLMTTIRAYDDLMAKLEVDIAIVGKEKERIIQIFLEYINDIHKNLGKIDKNSTIKIREKPIKMLRMDLPDWDLEENYYKNRLKDLIEGLTQSGINRLEANENIDDIISPIITTKNLYNEVVGINNINIKLYKIEAERQYQINWAEVSINSGGEGFLSAFVILSSLLSFMRRDDTDIFAELEEGKVLIMDNPFAQTSSSHLLNPLMNIAKKSNTQLIAFTALGGESIYNSFDNIYVLNLISSNLKKGMQYLKSHHTKGEDIEIMETSHVRTEDAEQLELLF